MVFSKGNANKYWYEIIFFNNVAAKRTPATSLLLLN